MAENSTPSTWIGIAAEKVTGKLILGYADEKYCLFFGLSSPNPNSYKPSVTPDAIDIVITKKL